MIAACVGFVVVGLLASLPVIVGVVLTRTTRRVWGMA